MVRAVRDLAWAQLGEEPWDSPKLVGNTRVRRRLAVEMEAMVADYAGGIGCVLVCRKYGIAENTVLARLKVAGVELRSPAALDAETIDEMASFRADGWTLRALGERYGLTRQTVAVRLRSAHEA